jgi:hypothetical protein
MFFVPLDLNKLVKNAPWSPPGSPITRPRGCAPGPSRKTLSQCIDDAQDQLLTHLLARQAGAGQIARSEAPAPALPGASPVSRLEAFILYLSQNEPKSSDTP